MSFSKPLFPTFASQGPTGPTGPTGTQTLAQTLVLGNNAGSTGIDMNNNAISNASLVNGLQVSSGVLPSNVNIGLGNLTLTTTGSANNVAVGQYIMTALTTGNYNNCVGTNAGKDITTGQGNNAYGSVALANITSGSFNTAMGNRAGQENILGSYNVYIGSQAGQNSTTGDEITAVGVEAGRNSSGNKNTFIGALSSITGGVSNSTVVGYGATTGIANTIQLGRTSENVNCPNTLSVAGTTTFTKQTLSTLGAVISTATITLALPLNNIYTITTAGAVTISLPTNSATYAGSIIIFRRIASNGVCTFNQTGGASVFMASASTALVSSVNMSASEFSTSFISDGTFWCQLYTI
jgi:hypothetical protein